MSEAIFPNAAPRPWAVDHGSVCQITADDGNTYVCEIDASYELDAAAIEAHVDADLIVTAVNEYDALLALERVARTMVSVIPATAPLSLLNDIARFLDEVDAQRGAKDETEMQDGLRDWDTDISDALARLDALRSAQ